MQYFEDVAVSRTAEGGIEIVSRRKYADGISYEGRVVVEGAAAGPLADALEAFREGGQGRHVKVGDATIEVFQAGSDMDPSVAIAVDWPGGYAALDCSFTAAKKLAAELKAV